MGFGEAHRDDDTFAGGEAVGFDDDRCAAFVNVNMCCERVGKRLVDGGRDLMPHHEGFGEILRAFELSGGSGRSENGQTAGAERIDHTGGKRGFRPDDGQRYPFALDEIGERGRICERHVRGAIHECGAAVAGGDEHVFDTGRLEQFPGEGVFAAA